MSSPLPTEFDDDVLPYESYSRQGKSVMMERHSVKATNDGKKTYTKVDWYHISDGPSTCKDEIYHHDGKVWRDGKEFRTSDHVLEALNRGLLKTLDALYLAAYPDDDKSFASLRNEIKNDKYVNEITDDYKELVTEFTMDHMWVYRYNSERCQSFCVSLEVEPLAKYAHCKHYVGQVLRFNGLPTILPSESDSIRRMYDDFHRGIMPDCFALWTAERQEQFFLDTAVGASDTPIGLLQSLLKYIKFDLSQEKFYKAFVTKTES